MERSSKWYATGSGGRAGNWLGKALRLAMLRLRTWNPRPPRSLHLRETLTLGEKRLVAVVEFEEQRFLLGATGGSIAMLARLADSSPHVTHKLPKRAAAS